MTDDPVDDPAGRLGSGNSEAWIDRIAESEGVSREEVVERLVSSYWTLREIHGLMETTEESADAPEAAWPLDAGPSYPETLSDDLADVRERVERLEDALPDEDATRSTDELSAQVKMLAQRVSAVKESLAGRQDALDSRLDGELDNLETILEYLIETTDDLAADVEALADEQRADRRRRAEEDRLADLKRLASRLDVRTAECAYCGNRVDVALLPTPECPQCDRAFTDVEPATGWFGFGSNVLSVTEEPYLDDGAAGQERTVERTDGSESVDEEREATDVGSGEAPVDDSPDSFVWGDQRD